MSNMQLTTSSLLQTALVRHSFSVLIESDTFHDSFARLETINNLIDYFGSGPTEPDDIIFNAFVDVLTQVHSQVLSGYEAKFLHEFEAILLETGVHFTYGRLLSKNVPFDHKEPLYKWGPYV